MREASCGRGMSSGEREGWETGWAEMVSMTLGGTRLHRPTQGTGELLPGRKGKL